MSDATMRKRVQDFILENLLLGDRGRMPSDDASLLDSGVIDSTGVLELIEFLEEAFGITVADDETVPENLDGVDQVVAYAKRKQA